LSGQDFEDVALASCDVCCMLKSTHVLLKVYGKTISVLKTLSAEDLSCPEIRRKCLGALFGMTEHDAETWPLHGNCKKGAAIHEVK